MAEPLKYMFSEKLVDELAIQFKKASSDFNVQGFKKGVLSKNWNQLELKERMHRITQQLHSNLPLAYDQQIKILDKTAPLFSGFVGVIFPNFVEQYGQHHEKLSMEALRRYTPYSSSEFAVRPFLKNNPELIRYFYDWSTDKNHHVRRLASEGCRPLLPWAMKLDQYVQDPSPILPILETLKNDQEDYVYRSVANSLNDISKNHSKLVLDLGKKWVGKSETTDWVLKHALRTLLKKGEPKAMQLFGFAPGKSLNVSTFSLAKSKIAIGDATTLKIDLTNEGAKAKFRLEYAISYLKNNGSHNDKVFQISEKWFDKNQREVIEKKVDFKNLSTRKHYPGQHFIHLKINGIVVNSVAFVLA